MGVMDNLNRATSYDQGSKLLGGVHPAHEKIQKEKFMAGEWLVFYNDNIRFGYHITKPEHDRYGLHVQGYVGDDTAEFANETVNVAKNLNLPYVYFTTDNDQIVNDVSSVLSVEKVRKESNGTTYRVKV